MIDKYRIDDVDKDPFLIDVGRRLYEKRKSMRLSQEGLAHKAETSKQTVSRAENGERELRIKTFARLANALETSTDFLLNGATSFEGMAKMAARLHLLDDQQQQYITESLRMLNDMADRLNK